jgi:hypothetical protein
MGESQKDSAADDPRPDKTSDPKPIRPTGVFDGAVQVLAAIPALAIVGYCVGAIVFAVKLADGGIPVMSALEAISARQLLMTGVGAIVPISFVYILLALVIAFVVVPSMRGRANASVTPSQAIRKELLGSRWVALFMESAIARIVAAVLVLGSALFLPIGPILGFGILAMTMLGLIIYGYVLDVSEKRRAGERLIVLLLCVFLTGLGAGIFAIGLRGPQFPVAELKAEKEGDSETVGLLGTNGPSASVVTCDEQDGFSENPTVRVVDIKHLEITDDEFHLNPASKTSLFQIITGINFGLNDQTKNKDDDLCGS